MILEVYQQMFETSSNIKFHENPSSGSRAVPFGMTGVELTVAFRNFANAPKNRSALYVIGRIIVFFL
jgi:hypothetical protein